MRIEAKKYKRVWAEIILSVAGLASSWVLLEAWDTNGWGSWGPKIDVKQVCGAKGVMCLEDVPCYAYNTINQQEEAHMVHIRPLDIRDYDVETRK